MEFASRLRWIIVIGFVLLALILVGWGLFAIARNIFDDGDSSNTSNSSETSQDFNVTSTATARYTVDGPVIANNEHRSYTIEVSQNVVSMTVFKSYGQVVVAQKTYTNTAEAFDTFLRSLESVNVTERQKNTDESDDFAEVGVCPTGKRFIIELDTAVRRWNTSCRNELGTAGSGQSQAALLFERQILREDFNELVRGTGL